MPMNASTARSRDSLSAAGTHRSGVGDVRGGVTDDAVADQVVTRE